MRAALLALSGAIALGGCAADKLTLLENEEGNETGAVAILDPVTGEERVEVNTKLTEAKLTSRPKPRTVKELKPAYNELLTSLPPKARIFPFKFEKDATSISPDQYATFGLIKDELRLRKGAQIEVLGFTNSLGDEDLNNRISKDRAKSVATELRVNGIEIDPMDEVGRGEYAARDVDGDEKANEEFRTVLVLIR